MATTLFKSTRNYSFCHSLTLFLFISSMLSVFEVRANVLLTKNDRVSPIIEIENMILRIYQYNVPTSFSIDLNSAQSTIPIQDNLAIIDLKQVANDGVHVGNGGRIVGCILDNQDKRINQLYFYDYASYLYKNGDLKYNSITSQFISSRIKNTFQQKIALVFKSVSNKLSEDYLQFINSYSSGQSNQVSWVRLTGRLPIVPHEYDIPKLPSFCSLQLQAVIRSTEAGSKIIYYIDYELMELLEQFFSKQFSMILLHEFLWNVPNLDIEEKARINIMIHDDSYSAAEITATIKSLFNY